MYLDNETDELLDILKSAENLKEIEFIKACPYAKKPTKLLKRCVRWHLPNWIWKV